jgi:ABC-type nitrate/sulfonate/bicarbonate transport system substrate-binding protein
MKLPTPALIALPTTVALLLAACGSDSPTTDGTENESAGASPQRSATLVLDWTPNTNHSGIYIADAEGFYDDVGIDINIIQPGETGSLQAVGTGNAEFGISVQEALIPARAAELPAVSIAAILEKNTSSLIALEESGIASPADLEGKRYGGFGGQLETALIDTLVECDGGDPTAVDTIEVGNTDYRVGLERGDFDFVWVFEGWDKIRLEQAGVDVVSIPFIDYEDCIPNWYTPLIVTSESLINNDPDLVRDFVEATARGYRVAIDDPETAANHLLEAAPELDEQLVRASAEYLSSRYAANPAAWGQQDPATWIAFNSFITSAGLIDTGIDVDAAYTNEFLPEQ